MAKVEKKLELEISNADGDILRVSGGKSGLTFSLVGPTEKLGTVVPGSISFSPEDLRPVMDSVVDVAKEAGWEGKVRYPAVGQKG